MGCWQTGICFRSLVLAAALHPIGVAAATRQAPQEVWGLECRSISAENQTCVLEQSLSHRGKWLATIRLAPEKTGARMQVQLPAGIHLASGLFYSVDKGRDLPLEFLRCDDQRCYAYRALDAQEFKAIQRGKSMTLRLRPEVQLRPATMQVSLAGITALSNKALK